MNGRKNQWFKKSFIISCPVIMARTRVGDIFFSFLCILCLQGFWPEKICAADPVTVQLKWVHQAQFAGFYMAQEEGFYQDENLDVSFLEGGKDVFPVTSIVEGKAGFSVMSPDDIFINRLRGVPIKAIAAIYRKSAVVFLSMPGSGIRRPHDFPGKTIAAAGEGAGVQDFFIQYSAMMHQLGIDTASIHLVPFSMDFSDFYAGKVDIIPVYVTAGLIKIQQKGLRPNIIWPGDYRVRFYSDTLVTTDAMIATHPDVVTRFLRATLRGWTRVIQQSEKALEVTMKYARIKDKTLQMAMLNAQAPLVHTGDETIGWMRPEEWTQMHNILLEQKLLPVPLSPVSQLYTLDFIKALRQVGGKN